MKNALNVIGRNISIFFQNILTNISTFIKLIHSTILRSVQKERPGRHYPRVIKSYRMSRCIEKYRKNAFRKEKMS
jgi:hypothetical protein